MTPRAVQGKRNSATVRPGGRSGEIGFVLHDWNIGMMEYGGYLDREYPGGRLGSFCAIGPSLSRRPPDVPACPSLASFCMIGIGLEYWNDGTVEWWGIRPAGSAKLGSFCTFGPRPTRPRRELGSFRTFHFPAKPAHAR